MPEAQPPRIPAQTAMRVSPHAAAAQDVSTVAPDGAPLPSNRQAQQTEDDFTNPDLAVLPPPPRDLSGTLLLDRYKLIKRLGEGGMGTVYCAEHVTIKKRCAIKILNPEYAHKQDLVERFLQEARAASMIAHENVVEITDYGAAPNGSVFFVMEMLIGEDLGETIKREAPMQWSRIAPMAMQICRALAAAHDKGIVHRDMKPENCFRIERSGNPDFIKVLDFGIAKVTTEDPDGTGARLTSTGMIFGTPTYMSPEQAQGMTVDHRSDIYAVGVILYELLTGRPPFYADNFMGILTKHMFDSPHAPSEVAPDAGISPEVEALVLKALQKEREYRFQSMQELMAAMQAVGTGAAPVTVVPELRARPASEGRPIDFNRAQTGPIAITTEFPQPSARRSRMWAVAATCAIIGTSAVIVALALGGGEARTEAPPSPAPVVAAMPPDRTPEPRPAKPEPTPEPTPAPTPAEVRVFVTSNVPAEIVDPADARVLGPTGDAGIVLTGSAPRKVLVRASGYEDLPLELTASDGGRYTADLKPKKKAGPGSKPPKHPGETKADPKAPDKPEPKTPEVKPPLGLKNPFETRPGG